MSYAQSAPTAIASTYAGIRGIPAIFPRQAIRDLLALRGDKGARALLAQPPWPVICVALEGGEGDIERPEDLAPKERASAVDWCFDITVGLVDGNEDVVGIVLPERTEIRKQVVQVRHGEMDARDFGSRGEGSLAHVE